MEPFAIAVVSCAWLMPLLFQQQNWSKILINNRNTNVSNSLIEISPASRASIKRMAP
jgi:hypothetical protein